MSSAAAASGPTCGPGHSAIGGRPGGMPRARAIAADGPGMAVVAREPSPALAPFVEWIAYYDLKLSRDWRELVRFCSPWSASKRPLQALLQK